MNYYEVLEVSPKASEDVIRTAYEALVAKYNPETFDGGKAFANMKIIEIYRAYSVLSNPSQRYRYDMENIKDFNRKLYANLDTRLELLWRKDFDSDFVIEARMLERIGSLNIDFDMCLYAI